MTSAWARLSGLGFDVKGRSNKRCQVNELETEWRGFLVDADAAGSLPFLHRAIRATAHDDRDIVKEAWPAPRKLRQFEVESVA